MREEDYVAVGRIAGSIDKKAEAVVVALSKTSASDLATLECVMKALTDLDERNLATRRPRKRSELLALVSERMAPAPVVTAAASLDRVLASLKAEDTSFLMIGDGEDPGVDIGHEALMSSWERLSGPHHDFAGGWLREERNDGERWREYLRRADESAILGSRELGTLDDRVSRRMFGEVWSGRYGDQWHKVEALKALSSKAARHRRLRVGVVALVIFAGMIGWLNEGWLRDRWRWFTVIQPYMTTKVRPHVLSAEAERALKPMGSFKECMDICPEMVVVQAGSFMMGSPATEPGRDPNESDTAGRQHAVAFSKPFAISKFEVTFEEWGECVAYGDCSKVSDNGWGGAKQPVINVSWDDAETYVKWLARMTGKAYRLPSEAEWEYAARAGTQTAYSWGDEFSKGHANCNGCDSQWDNARPAPVGSFAANAWGLYDMQGNVWQWVGDCYHDNYDGAPTDGSLWPPGDCQQRVMRGGSVYSIPRRLRPADRQGKPTRSVFPLSKRALSGCVSSRLRQ